MGLLSQRPDMQMAQRLPAQDVCGNSQSFCSPEASLPAAPLRISTSYLRVSPPHPGLPHAGKVAIAGSPSCGSPLLQEDKLTKVGAGGDSYYRQSSGVFIASVWPNLLKEKC